MPSILKQPLHGLISICIDINLLTIVPSGNPDTNAFVILRVLLFSSLGLALRISTFIFYRLRNTPISEAQTSVKNYHLTGHV